MANRHEATVTLSRRVIVNREAGCNRSVSCSASSALMIPKRVEWVGLLGVLAPPAKRGRLVSDDSEGHQDAILARVGPFVCQLLTGETCDPFVGLVLGHFGFADEIDVPAFAPK